MSLPLASLSQNVKYYRHALALDERRVKFLAEYLDDKVQPEAASEQSKPDVKEVWFVGTHSDVYVFLSCFGDGFIEFISSLPAAAVMKRVYIFQRSVSTG